jgi:hypothetical protein
MTLLDFILNIAGLLLWLNWRSAPPTFMAHGEIANGPRGSRMARARARWFYLAALAGLLAGRAVFYWEVGPQLDWRPGIPLGPVHLFFRSDLFGRMLLFSGLSFGATLGLFYLFLLTLSLLNSSLPDADPAQRLVRWHLGPVGRWPGAVKLLLPMIVTLILWISLHPLLSGIDMLPRETPWHLLAHGALIGLASYLVLLKFLVAGLLILHLLQSYVYLGDFAFWESINVTARGFLLPLQWLPLRAGRVDFAPVVGVALVLVTVYFGEFGLDRLYR